MLSDFFHALFPARQHGEGPGVFSAQSQYNWLECDNFVIRVFQSYARVSKYLNIFKLNAESTLYYIHLLPSNQYREGKYNTEVRHLFFGDD